MSFCPFALVLLPCLPLALAEAGGRTEPCKHGECHAGAEGTAVLLQSRMKRNKTEGQLSSVPEASYGIHARSHRIVLHHIWKTGGTHLCQLAAKAGFAVPHNSGCHRWKDDAAPISKKETNASEWTPCAITPRIHELPFDVIGHECMINSTDIDIVQKEGFSLVGVVRDPIEQAASWYMHAGRQNFGGNVYHNITAWIKGCNPTHKCGWYTFKDNLPTRWHAGGKLSVELALANLARFDVVLEQRGAFLHGLPKLEQLDWKQPYTHSNYTSGAIAYLEGKMPTGELQYLKTVQRYDTQLIHMARSRGLISQEPGFSEQY